MSGSWLHICMGSWDSSVYPDVLRVGCVVQLTCRVTGYPAGRLMARRAMVCLVVST